MRDSDGNLSEATSLQIPGVLDSLFSHDNPLGATFERAIDVVSGYHASGCVTSVRRTTGRSGCAVS